MFDDEFEYSELEFYTDADIYEMNNNVDEEEIDDARAEEEAEMEDL